MGDRRSSCGRFSLPKHPNVREECEYCSKSSKSIHAKKKEENIKAVTIALSIALIALPLVAWGLLLAERLRLLVLGSHGLFVLGHELLLHVAGDQVVGFVLHRELTLALGR